jgi:hypothetical protein
MNKSVRTPTRGGLCTLLACIIIGSIAVWMASLLLAVTSPAFIAMNDVSMYGIPMRSSQLLYENVYPESIGTIGTDKTLINEFEYPCEDFSLYACGQWHANMKNYADNNPDSFSTVQKKAVGLYSNVITNTTPPNSVLRRFYDSCTRTRSDTISWGINSQIYVDLIDTIRDSPWNKDTMATVMGKMAALGMDLPFSVVPIRSPIDRTRGGWTLLIKQAGMIGGGDFESKRSSIHQFDPAPWSYYSAQLSELSSLYESDSDGHTPNEANKKGTVTLLAMRETAKIFMHQTSRTCWVRSEDDSYLWGEYFGNPSCYDRDNNPRTLYDQRVAVSEEQQDAGVTIDNSMGEIFNWELFVNQIDPDAWAKIVNVWVPQGLHWLKTVSHYKFHSVASWRTYLESSVRYAIYRHYVAAIRSARDDIAGEVGILSPIIAQQKSDISHQFNKQWVPHLLIGSHGTVPLSRPGSNNIDFMSRSLCVDMTFLHLQYLAEIQLMNDMGYGDRAVRDGFTNVFDSVRSTMRMLVTSGGGMAWTQAVRSFFALKLDKLAIVFSGSDDFELSSVDESLLFDQIVSASEGFVQNALVIRRFYIKRIWELNTPRSLQLPVFNVPAYYDRLTNTFVVSSNMFFWPLYTVDQGDRSSLYGRSAHAIAQALAYMFTESGRATKEDGSIMDRAYWLQSIHTLDRASFLSTQTCLIDMFQRNIQINDDPSTVEDMVASNIALRVAYNAFRGDKSPDQTIPGARQFFISLAQSQCLRIGDSAIGLQKTKSIEDFYAFYITLPLANLHEWAQLYLCDDAYRALGSCDFFA